MKMETVVSFAITLAYVLVLDAIFIGLVLKRFFGPMIKQIQKSQLKLRWSAAISCYFVIAFGISYFVLPNVNEESVILDSAKYGLLFGLTVYAVYDLTNLSLFRDYKFEVAILDMSWGAALGFLATLFTKLTLNAIKK